MTRTWEQQKTYEWNVRKRWLEALIGTGMTQSAAAQYAGIDRASLVHMCAKYGVRFQTARSIKADKRAEAARKKAEDAKRAKAEQAARDELRRRTSKLISEGFTEQQALRAVAHQMGVRA